VAAADPGRALHRQLALLGPWLGLLCAWGLFAVAAGSTFVALENQRLMLLQTAVVGTAAVGATLVISSGGIDLSVGSAIALTTVVLGALLRAGLPPLLAVAAAVATAVGCGVVVGTLVVGRLALALALAAAATLLATTAAGLGWILAGGLAAVALAGGIAADRRSPRLPLSPFIVTLGLWGALRGCAKGLADNQPVYAERLSFLPSLMTPAERGLFALLPAGVWLLLVVAAAMAFVLRATRFGRHALAIGSNEATARLCGVDVGARKLGIYAVAGLCTGLAGVLQFSYLSMGDPTTAQGLELDVIAAVVIGGASLAGGEGSIVGTLAGALLMTVIDNGCAKLGVDNWVQEIVTGGIIVAAVALDRVRARG
jgi:ribose/xylose/arabinose/galactoside ABC-type transport system permease subunit